ncbi:Zinc finger CCHC domain-containing protein 2 [Frankliniella fusca]|uniref:Zinc finger CCHC domain-containing protein 2 n=1 Tax=Frankliniella fusca TaxID=407009 RepID=A0AAE1GXV7_9NEOP|nr:Zinc finger CCHC domain-containing protein 2 [Frankliniella fusca]
MLVKNDVLSDFRNVRSFERVDLLCSLLDLCLPYELRFLGTCLEFLGKRDFYELREDERDANNVNHLSSYRSLMDENTRRKLVLYVSLLKSCNTEGANCLSDTLTALCPVAVAQICRSEPENAENVLDELLLLYTIAVKHPAFNVHQKTEFAERLSRLKEEDQKFSLALLSANKNEVNKASRLSKSPDAIPETPCKPKEKSANSTDNQDSSSQISVMSQPNQLTCPVLSGSVYTSAVLPSPLHQATCLNPAHVMVSSVSSPVAQLTDSLAPDPCSRLGSDSGPVTWPGMIMPLTPSTSHCMMSTSGEMGLPKGSLSHHSMMQPMMCMPPDSIPVGYPGHAHFGMMVPIVGHIPGPPIAPPPVTHNPSNKPVTSIAHHIPVASPISTAKSPPIACSSYSIPSPSTAVSTSSALGNQVSIPKDNNSKIDEDERPCSRPTSPFVGRVETPPPTSKMQVSHSKSGPETAQSTPNPIPVPGPTPQPFQNSPTVYMTAECLPPAAQGPTTKAGLPAPNQLQQFPNQIVTVGNAYMHLTSKPGSWFAPSDNLKEVIVREMPKYKANLQDLSPDELLHMGDDQLKDLGLPLSAIQQLRSIMNKLHSSNGINCSNRSDGMFHNENAGSRRRHYYASDNKAIVPGGQGPPPGTLSYGYMVPSSHPMSNGGTFHKSNKRHQHLQLTNQVRALQLEDESRRPCSNSSSTSDSSSGSHSPPETPSLPLISEVPNFDKGYSGKDSGAESWNSTVSEDKIMREDRLHDREQIVEERSQGQNFQPPGMQRNSVNRSRGLNLSKAPPGIPTIPRGRGHPIVDKNRRDPVSPMNGVPSDMNTPPPPYALSAGSGISSNAPYHAPSVSSFLPHSPFTAMHTFHRFQSGSFLPTGPPYPFPPSGEMWSPFPQPPQPTPPYLTNPIVAFSPAHPPPKLSCYNCGRQGHQGSDCKDVTLEEITRQGQYHLDYRPGDCRETEK